MASTASVASGSFDERLAALCPDQIGQPLLAAHLTELQDGDGSARIGQVLATCDVVFTGAVDAALGRPTTNVEAIIADPANNVTPNQAQTDALNQELALYWRIAQSVLAQATGASTTTVAPTTATTTPSSSVPTSATASLAPSRRPSRRRSRSRTSPSDRPA